MTTRSDTSYSLILLIVVIILLGIVLAVLI